MYKHEGGDDHAANVFCNFSKQLVSIKNKELKQEEKFF